MIIPCVRDCRATDAKIIYSQIILPALGWILVSYYNLTPQGSFKPDLRVRVVAFFCTFVYCLFNYCFMYKKTCIIFVFIIQAFCALNLAAAGNLNVETGLSNNFIHTLFRDSEGMVWIGTETGLDRYDGMRIVSYARRFSQPLKGAVQSMYEISTGQFVVATSWGAFNYTVRTNKMEYIDFGVQGIDVRSVARSPSGEMYYATERGVFITLQGRTKANLVDIGKFTQAEIICLFTGDRNEIMLAGKNFVGTLNRDKATVIALNIPDIKSALYFKNSVYLGTVNGLYRYFTQNGTAERVPGFEGMQILALTSDGKNTIIGGTAFHGIQTRNMHDGRLESFTHGTGRSGKPALSSNSIYALLYNRGMLFAGTFSNGVDMLYPGDVAKFRQIDYANRTGTGLRSMYIASDGYMYLGTRDGRLICADAAGNMIYEVSAGPGVNVITTISAFPGAEHILSIGTFGNGIRLFDAQKRIFKPFDKDKFLDDARVYKFIAGSPGKLWIATLKGLYRYNYRTETYEHYDLQPVTGSNEVFSMAADAKGNLWLGTKTGICRFDTTTLKAIQPAYVRPYRYQCTSVYADKQGSLWFCFNKGGVLKLNARLEKELWLTTEILIPENAPSSVIEDRESRIWIGSSKGLFMLNSRNELHAYGPEDGLQGIGISPESAVANADGKLWWCNETGLVSLIDARAGLNKYVPPLKLVSLSINGTPYDADTLNNVQRTDSLHYKITIKGKSNNNPGFGLAVLNYVHPHKNRLYYRLSGQNEYIALPAGQQQVSFGDLATGSYRLEVLAANNDGVRSERPLVIDFSIEAHFYEAGWFVILMALGLVGLLLYFTRHYVRRMRFRLLGQLEEMRRKSQTSVLKMPESKGNDIQVRLLAHMREGKPYLNPALRQADVAEAISCQVHELSNVLNVQMAQSFPDLVNAFRIEEFKLRIARPEAYRYTLAATAMQCGFSSKSSFLRAFKKNCGMTPTEYLNEQGLQADGEI